MQPVLDTVLLVGVEHIQYQRIDAAHQEEERMGNVHEVRADEKLTRLVLNSLRPYKIIR